MTPPRTPEEEAAERYPFPVYDPFGPDPELWRQLRSAYLAGHASGYAKAIEACLAIVNAHGGENACGLGAFQTARDIWIEIRALAAQAKDGET